MITREFNLYLHAGHSIPLVINANQYDRGEQWLFTLFNSDGTKYVPSSGAIVGIKSDKLGIINSGTVDSDGRVVINETQQMTAAVGKAVFELLIDDQTHGTANFVVLVEPKPGDNADLSESDLSLIQQAIDGTSATAIAQGVSDWMDENLTPTTPVVDTSLTVSGAAADSAKVGQELSDLKSEISTNTGIPYAVKLALNHIIQNVAFKNDTDYSADKATINAWATSINVTSITAVYTQSGAVYSTDSLDDLKSDLVVTAFYDNETSGVVSGYTLSGELTYGDSVITVTYGGKTATFTVSVTDVLIIPLEYHGLTETTAAGSTYAQCKNSTNQRYRPVDLIPVQEGDKLVITGDNVPSGQYLALWTLYFGSDQLYTGINSGEWANTELTIPSGYPYASASIGKKPNADNLTSVTNLTLKRIRSPQ